MKDFVRLARLRVPPSDQVLLGLLGLAVLVAALRLAPGGHEVAVLLAVQSVLLAFFGATVVALARWEKSRRGQWIRAISTVTIIFILYTSLGKLGVAAMPYLADAGLSRADNWLFGFDPSLAIQRYQTPGRVEFFSFIYGAFIPYIYLSLFLGCLGRPALERD